ncbi:helix-turn-helix domain-containing protein [Kitasatospora sp. NPDC056076]|uniref:helix-turn-helix domain-containing protein n=2 Tax=Streptomycetaceae TaxID=2062 RepID=UPI0035E01A66
MSDVKRDELSRLCRERREELGLSMAQLAAASGDDAMASSWVARLETGQLRDIPRRERLAALAKGLRLSYQTVARAAAAQFLDVEDDAVWSADGTVRVVVDRMGEMNETGRQELAQIAELFSRRPTHGSGT